MTRRLRALAPLAVVALTLGACGASGFESATKVQGFTSCLDQAGASTDGSSDWDAEEQLSFWAEPGTLACAEAELDDDQLQDALEDAFVDPEDADDFVATAQGQQASIRALGSYVAEADGVEAAVAAVGRVLDAVPNGEDHTLRRLAALGIVEGTGGLPGYQAYLAESGQDDSADALSRYDDHVEAEGPDELRDRLRELSVRLRDAT